MRTPELIPNIRQLQGLDWLANDVDQVQEMDAEKIDEWQRRIEMIGTLADPMLEAIRQVAIKMLHDHRLPEPMTSEDPADDVFINLTNLLQELSMLADPENDEDYSGPKRQFRKDWPYDHLEEMNARISRGE